VQALPYLMEYPYECAEQTFNRFYANALAGHIANSSPRLQEVFNKWKTTDTAALLEASRKKPGTKNRCLLQETPWVLQGKSESPAKTAYRPFVSTWFRIGAASLGILLNQN